MIDKIVYKQMINFELDRNSWSYLPNPPLVQDMSLGQFLSGV